MIQRIARLTAAEFIKLFASPFLYISLGILLVFTVGAEYLQPIFQGQHATAWRSLHAVQLFVYGFKPGLQIATYILVIFSSMMFAGEFDRGTIKNLLTRPITRTDFFLAKCVTTLVLTVLLFGYVFYCSLGMAFLRGDLGPVWDHQQYIMVRSSEEIVHHAWKAVGMSFLSFLAAGFLGILISNLTESSGYAVAIALVVFLFGSLISGMLIDATQQKIFFYYPGYALGKLEDLAEGINTRWSPNIDNRRLYITVPLAYIAAFIPLAFIIFRRRNITA